MCSTTKIQRNIAATAETPQSLLPSLSHSLLMIYQRVFYCALHLGT